MLLAKDIAQLMATYPYSTGPQLSQTEFRMRLVEDWQIPEGARVLEIGCGQGDTTAALANAVGASGHVTAVDIAAPEYGAPVNLGDSAAHLKAGPLGGRIDFRFEFDAFDGSNAFPKDSFDYVVLAHCTWYFESLSQLRQTLRTVRAWAPKICLSEWDLEPRSPDQMAHLLAVLIQGQVESFKVASSANIRTPFSRRTLKEILSGTGWQINSEHLMDATNLDDARWEVTACLNDSLREASDLRISDKFESFLESQVEILRSTAENAGMRPLSAYSIVATRIAVPEAGS